MPQAGLKSVVAGVTETAFKIIIAEVRPEGPARSVDHLLGCGNVTRILGKWPAGGGARRNRARLAQREAQGGVAGICRIYEQEVMGLRSDVTQIQNGVPVHFALDGEEIVLAVRVSIAPIRRCHTSLRN